MDLLQKVLQERDLAQRTLEIAILERDLARCEAGIIGQYVPSEKADEIREELAPIYAEFATKIPHPFEPEMGDGEETDTCSKCGLSADEGPHGGSK